jgi:hypothetical protein
MDSKPIDVDIEDFIGRSRPTSVYYGHVDEVLGGVVRKVDLRVLDGSG